MEKKINITGIRLVDSIESDELPGDIRTVFNEELLLIKAASSSLKDACAEKADKEQTGIILGVDGLIDEWKEGFFKEVLMEGPLGASPLVFPFTSPNALAARTTIAMGIKGEDITLASGPLSLLKAVSYSFGLITSGIIKGAVVGGVTKGKALTMFLGGENSGCFLYGAIESRGDGKTDGCKTIGSMEETFSIFIDSSRRQFDPGSYEGGFSDPAPIDLCDRWGNRTRLYMGISS